jgi:hypothetical protein
MSKIQEAKKVVAEGQLVRFMPRGQFRFVVSLLDGEEGEHFAEKVLEYHQRIESMPKTYEQDGKGDQAIAYLHYFIGGANWYITEKDMEDGVSQAFGLANLSGDATGIGAELGYISITELRQVNAELDLYFEPKTLAELGYKRG